MTSSEVLPTSTSIPNTPIAAGRDLRLAATLPAYDLGALAPFTAREDARYLRLASAFLLKG